MNSFLSLWIKSIQTASMLRCRGGAFTVLPWMNSQSDSGWDDKKGEFL